MFVDLKYFILVTALIATFSSCVTNEEHPNLPTTKRTNIIFIMSDDHAYQAISAYDNNMETPNIYRFLADAVKGNVYGLNKEKAKQIQAKRAADKASTN